MNYYIEQDGKIKLHDINSERLVNTLRFMPQYTGLEIKETDRPIENGEWADTQEYIAKKHLQEVEKQVAQMETRSGLTRIMRELVLSADSAVSEYAKSKAQEIETLAQELRGEQ